LQAINGSGTNLTRDVWIGNNSAIVSWSENPNAILIKEKAISDGFRGYFEYIWKVKIKRKI